ncbi:unnamed protein product [Parnassius apollo]|uniref:(apollo) hypothetical protein n=1 Tax=Parnassius apollo TaxID=110799 RepID=A0A8S3VZD5_PARAO|nr:unnamed protein product [Parnassius apollo]
MAQNQRSDIIHISFRTQRKLNFHNPEPPADEVLLVNENKEAEPPPPVITEMTNVEPIDYVFDKKNDSYTLFNNDKVSCPEQSGNQLTTEDEKTPAQTPYTAEIEITSLLKTPIYCDVIELLPSTSYSALLQSQLMSQLKQKCKPIKLKEKTQCETTQ